MLWGSWVIAVALLASPSAGARAPDAGVGPREGAHAKPKVPRSAPPDGGVGDDEQLAAELDLLENLDVLERLDQYDLEER